MCVLYYSWTMKSISGNLSVTVLAFIVIAQQESSYPLLKPDSEIKQRILYPGLPHSKQQRLTVSNKLHCSLLCKKNLIQNLFLRFVWLRNLLIQIWHQFFGNLHLSRKFCDKFQLKEKADIDVCMWLPVKSVSMTRVIQWTLFSCLAQCRVSVTILAWWMTLSLRVTWQLRSLELRSENQRWSEWPGEHITNTELRPEWPETGAWDKHRVTRGTEHLNTTSASAIF